MAKQKQAGRAKLPFQIVLLPKAKKNESKPTRVEGNTLFLSYGRQRELAKAVKVGADKVKWLEVEFNSTKEKQAARERYLENRDAFSIERYVTKEGEVTDKILIRGLGTNKGSAICSTDGFRRLAENIEDGLQLCAEIDGVSQSPVAAPAADADDEDQGTGEFDLDLD